ncbi:MAG: efflux RND transporter periplasmic adaptor subunit [Sandaracinaceae bacterium]|nr:efflux RND transporter periplasmic adaptor subunit [Sandaracinaceae bacterium]
MPRSRTARALLGLALAATSLVGCDAFGGEDDVMEDPPRLVVVERVAIDDAVERVTLLGDLHGEQEVRVVTTVPERIRVLHVHEGDPVEAGDPLVTLESDLQASSLQQASAAVSVAESARDQLRADLARAEGLAARGALPQQQIDTLRAQVRSADAQLSQTQAARRTASEQRGRTVIRAPITGTVALLTVQQGDMVAPSVPICSVVTTERLTLRLRLTEQDYVRVRQGMQVEVRPPALPEIVRMATVSRISPVIDPITRTATVEASLDNADGQLRPGMVAEASIVLERREGVVLAPSRALVLSSRTDTEREAFVFVFDREGGVARRAALTLGRRYGSTVAVESGLEGGEEVVVQGQHLLRDGAPIRVADAPPPVAALPAAEASP